MPHLGNVLLEVSVYQADELVGAETFRERHIIVGRDPTMADLVIASRKISREHILLEHDGLRIFVHDLSSTNGIYLNGFKIDRAEVGPTDRIYVGGHALQLSLRHSQAALAAMHEAALQAPSAGDEELPPRIASVEDDAPFFSEDAQIIETAAPRRTINLEAWERQGLTDAAGDVDAPQDASEVPAFSLIDRLLHQPTPVDDALPPRQLRLTLLKSRGEQVLRQEQVLPGARYRVPAGHVRERWGAVRRGRSPLSARLGRNGVAHVQLRAGCTWHLRRGMALLDEITGVREGWARRTGDVVWVSMQRQDAVSLVWGSVTYHLQFAPAANFEILRAPHPARASKATVVAFGCSLFLHAAILLGTGLMNHLQHDDRVRLALPPPASIGSAARPIGPYQTVLAATPATSPPDRVLGGLRVPGGSQGYRAFGLVDAPVTYDPQVPAPGSGVTLKRAAAFLRGDGSGFGGLVPIEGKGPQWRLVPAAGQRVNVSDPSRLSAEAATAVLEKSSVALQACYQQALPKDAGLTGRVALSWLVSQNGAVRTVYPSTAAIEAPLFACLSQVLSRLHFARFHGADVTLSFTFVFQRLGFE